MKTQKNNHRVFWRCRYCNYEVTDDQMKHSNHRYCSTCGAHFNHFNIFTPLTMNEQKCKHPKGFEQDFLEADEPRCPDCKLTLSDLNKSKNGHS